MKNGLVRAWVAGLLGAMVAGVASAEEIYIDFYDDGTVNSSPEFYNVFHSAAANGPNHPLASTNSGLSMASLLDINFASTGVDAHLTSYNNDGKTAAGGENVAIGEISGIATNASGDAFWCNDQGTAGSDFGFILTFSNLTGSAYNLSLLTATTTGSGAWSVTTGTGDASVEAYTTVGATSNTINWTSVVPDAGTIQLTSANTHGGAWKNVWLAFASLEAVAVSGAPPTADNISTNVTEDGSVNITLSGTDPDGGGVTYHLLSMPANGTLTTNGALPNLTYTPDADYVGSDSFSYFVNDGDFDSAPATVSFTVDSGNNDAPVADDIGKTVAEDGSVEITLSGSDIEGSNLTYAVVSGSGPSNGSLSDTTGQVLTYTPTPGFYGADSFSYTVNDGTQDSAPATVSITVIEVPDGELIVNGDFEADGYAAQYTEGSISDNYVTSVSDWTGNYADGNLRLEFDNGGRVPDYVNTVVRMQPGNWVYQNFTNAWSADNTFTVSFNACEVYWRAGGTDQNYIAMSLMDSTGSTTYTNITINLDGTHGGAATTYEDWTAGQTFSFEISGQDLVDAGAMGDVLRIHFDSVEINYLDNVTVIIDGGAPTTVGDISVEVVSGGTEVALTWPTEDGWNYGVMALGNLVFENWDAATIITNGVPGTGGNVTITNPVSPDVEFYRAYLDN